MEQRRIHLIRCRIYAAASTECRIGENEVMRKHVAGSAALREEPGAEQAAWLDLSQVARVEVTSEDNDRPIESAFGPGAGWRAATSGRQTIRLIFDHAQPIRRIYLRFEETRFARTQEFSLRWSGGRDESFREIVRQQWNFDPDGSTLESEDYRVSLSAVSILELNIDPDIGAGEARAALASWRLA
jgi:hypothetical protein